MTSISPLRREATKKVSFLRIGIFSALLFALVSVELFLSETALSTLYDQLMAEYNLTDKKGWQNIAAWFVKEFRYWLPVLTVALFHHSIYRKYNAERGVCQAEMAWQTGIVTALVYGGLLPYVIHVSNKARDLALSRGETIPLTAGGAEDTLVLGTVQWFVRVGVALLFILVYHASCAAREKKDTALEEKKAAQAAAKAEAAADTMEDSVCA